MSFLKKIFGRKEDLSYPEVHDFSWVGVDMHSHLIPGIDDGSKTMEESLELIRNYASLGFRKLITTPHIMSDAFRNTPEIILDGLERLRSAVKEAGIQMELDAAAEYYFDEGFVKHIKEKNVLPVSGKYLLFEVSYMNAPDNINQVIFDIHVAGFIPILAHPERYPFWYRDFDRYHKLRESGVQLQLNTNSLSGYYGPDAKKIAERMIDEGLVDFIGSDMHGMRHMEALKRSLREKHLWKIAAQGIKNSTL